MVKRTASVRAVTEVEVAELSREDFAAVLAAHPSFRKVVEDKVGIIV
jgi:CRP-like cAMP-binding protein